LEPEPKPRLENSVGFNSTGFNCVRRLARVGATAALAVLTVTMATAVTLAAAGGLTTAQARSASYGQSAAATGTIAVSQMPPEAVNTLHLIAAGGPYPYEKDGVVFGNYEHALPYHRRGYYHEYTVPTPRARNRGARRIVCGGPRQQTDNCYYTDDHYASFRRIVE